MGRRKKAVAQGWNAKNEERAKANKPKEKEDKPISEKEHKEKIDILKKIGLLKD